MPQSTIVEPPSDGPAADAGRQRLPLALLAVLGVLLVATRWLYLGKVAVECDQSVYACFGHLMVSGQRIYTDLWDHKPPLIYVAYALAERVVGFGDQEVLWLSATTTLLTLPAIYIAGARLGHSRWAGVCAGAVWTAVCTDKLVEGYTANTEVFINCATAWAFAMLLGTDGRVGRGVAVGIAFAVGSLFKHVVAPAAAVLVLAHILFLPPGRTRRQAVVQGLTIGGVGVAAWAAVAGYFAVLGRSHDFYTMVFAFNAGYVNEASRVGHGSVGWWANLTGVFDRTNVDVLCSIEVIGVALIVGVFATAVAGRTVRDRAMFVALAVATYVAIALPGQFFVHYFQLLLPPLAIGAGAAVTTLFPHDRSSRGAALRGRIAVAGLLLLFWHQWQDLQLLRQQQAVDTTRSLGQFVANHLRPDQTLFLWGSDDAPVYFYSRHMPPFGIMVARPVFDYPDAYPGAAARAMRERVDVGLTRTEPDLIVVQSACEHSFRTDATVASLIAGRYHRVRAPGVAAAVELFWRDDLPPMRSGR